VADSAGSAVAGVAGEVAEAASRPAAAAISAVEEHPVTGDRMTSVATSKGPGSGRWERLWKHLWLDQSAVRRVLPDAALDRLEAVVAEAERGHGGEIRLCVEAAFPFSLVWQGVTPRERAVSMFSQLRVWDTERNIGVLVYLLLADRAIEVVADRGLARGMAAADWEPVMAPLRAALRAGEVERGLAQAVVTVGTLLRARFPQSEDEQVEDIDELPNRPHVI
jgi:uncharacterized membrane protein